MFSKTTKKTSNSPSTQAKSNLFIQPALKVGEPGDKYEVEADRVADQVVANSNKEQSNSSFFSTSNPVQNKVDGSSDTEMQSKPFFGGSSPLLQSQSEEEDLQLKRSENKPEVLHEHVSEPGEVNKSSLTAEPVFTQQNVENSAEEKIQEQEEEEETIQTKEFVQKQEEKEELQTNTGIESSGYIQLQANSAGENNTETIESDLSNSKGGGSPMESTTKNEMESGFGTEFKDVRIHTDNTAVQMSEQLGAQAFTHGSDIYFNEGKYKPGTDSGKHLLAHELTHTLQQGASVQGKMIQKNDGETDVPTNPDDILKKFYLPAVKARHLSLYQTWASQGRLKRFSGYSRGRPNQIRVWKNHFWDKMQNTERLGLNEEFSGVKKIRTPGNKEIRGRRTSLLKKLTIANWDKNGRVLDNTMEVDHIVELQTGGWPNSSTPNEIENMELLDKSSNAAAGSKTKSNIETIVRNFLEASGESSTQGDAQTYMASNTVTFEQVELGRGNFAGSSPESKYWTRSEIEQGTHLGDLEDLGNIGEPGSPTEFAIMTPDDGYLMELFPHGQNENTISVAANSTKAKAVAGITISNITLNSNYSAAEENSRIGTITATWDLPSDFNAPEGSFPLPIKKSVSQYAGMVGDLPALGLGFEHMSPVELSGEYGVNEDGLYAEGRLTPTLQVLQGAAIVVGIRGTEVYFEAEYSPANLNIPVPGLTINSSTVRVGYSSENGFGVNGNVEFEMQSVASGTIEAGFTQEEGFSLNGDITFDESLFGRTQASAHLAYENRLWSIGGTLVIPQNQIRGVKQARIEADYSEQSGFTATGEAELDIPGIERGSMSAQYNNEGFSIEGNFNLSPDIPGIRSGNVEARIAKEEGAESYDVMVSGTAEPDIPGIDSSLSITYENGAITIEGSADYERGMLSGTVRVGATNRAIGEDGQPAGEPDETMRVYGGGSLTLQLTPWLEATAGVEFLPNGEMEVTGRIGLPSAVDVFDRREFRRNLFTVPTIEIPIFAIPLGPRSIGLVAQIGGGLDFSAGFGPGQLRDVYAEVTYNPDREDETEIRGHGEFAIPADAGLTLRGDLGLGVSIAIASLSGGIELAGTLGLEGEAAAEVDLSWSPQTGIVLDAEGRITVNPKFTFDVNAFARASLGIGWFSISETWRHNLVSFSWGPDIQFGIVFPVHYQEDQPFDISFDDIEVIYPDLDVVDMAKSLARDIKDDIFD